MYELEATVIDTKFRSSFAPSGRVEARLHRRYTSRGDSGSVLAGVGLGSVKVTGPSSMTASFKKRIGMT